MSVRVADYVSSLTGGFWANVGTSVDGMPTLKALATAIATDMTDLLTLDVAFTAQAVDVVSLDLVDLADLGTDARIYIVPLQQESEKFTRALRKFTLKCTIVVMITVPAGTATAATVQTLQNITADIRTFLEDRELALVPSYSHEDTDVQQEYSPERLQQDRVAESHLVATYMVIE